MIYITGDMHGDLDRLYSNEFKQLNEHDTLIIAGDFGFVWDGSKSENKLLKKLGSKKFNICFIDGPHDNLARIYSHRETIWKGGRVHRISGSLFHLCRGQIFNIEGCKIFTFGGGESSDKEIRNENNVWFKEELPSKRQMAAGAHNLESNNLKVDFFITHEPPAVVKRAMQMRAGKTIYTNMLNGYLEELNRNCEFSQWYFGSFHEDKVITPKFTAVFKNLIPINEFGFFNQAEHDDEYYDESKTEDYEVDLPLESINDDNLSYESDESNESEKTPPQPINLSELFVDDND